MTLLMLENKEKTFLLEQKKDQTEEINQLKAQAVFEPGLSYTDHFFSCSVI